MSSRRTAIVLLRSAEDNGKNKLDPITYYMWKRTTISTCSHLKTCHHSYYTFGESADYYTSTELNSCLINIISLLF